MLDHFADAYAIAHAWIETTVYIRARAGQCIKLIIFYLSNFFPAGHTMQLLLCCLFGLVLTQVSAVTFPECENVYHETCRTNFRYRSHHDWIPYANGSSENGIKWRVLVDQYDYQNVVGFTFPPSVWKNIDEDGDSRGVSIIIYLLSG